MAVCPSSSLCTIFGSIFIPNFKIEKKINFTRKSDLTGFKRPFIEKKSM